MSLHPHTLRWRASPCVAGALNALLAALCCFESSPVAAQAANAPAQPQSSAAESQLEEIVVTAQFRRQDIQTTPLAISAVSSATIESEGARNIADVTNRIPSVNFTMGSLGGSQTPLISIRGLSQTDFNLAVEPAVGMYIDDVYYGTIYGSLLDLLDLDRVEVLRGPQGTLAGANSEGGAIKLYSKVPTGDSGGYLEATYGSYKHHEFRGGDDFTLIPDKLFVRISGLGNYSDGYVKRYDYQCFTGQPPVQKFNPGTVGPFSPGGTSLNFVPASYAQAGPSGCQIGADGGTNVTAFRVAVRYEANENLEDTLTYDTTIDRSGPPASVLLHQGTIYGPGYNLLAGSPNLAANFSTPLGSYYNFATYAGLAGTPGRYQYDPVNSLDVWGAANTLVAHHGGHNPNFHQLGQASGSKRHRRRRAFSPVPGGEPLGGRLHAIHPGTSAVRNRGPGGLDRGWLLLRLQRHSGRARRA